MASKWEIHSAISHWAFSCKTAKKVVGLRMAICDNRQNKFVSFEPITSGGLRLGRGSWWYEYADSRLFMMFGSNCVFIMDVTRCVSAGSWLSAGKVGNEMALMRVCRTSEVFWKSLSRVLLSSAKTSDS